MPRILWHYHLAARFLERSTLGLGGECGFNTFIVAKIELQKQICLTSRYQPGPPAPRVAAPCTLQGHGKLGEECFLDLVHSHQLPVELEDHGSCIICDLAYVLRRGSGAVSWAA